MNRVLQFLKDTWAVLLAWRNYRSYPALADTGSCDDVVIDHDAPIDGAIDIMNDAELHAYCWRNVKALDPIKVSGAAMYLHNKLVEWGILNELIERITENHTGWLHGRPDQICWYCDGRYKMCPICDGRGLTHEHSLHFGIGMAIRNALRQGGYGEQFFGIDNIDDYYSPIVELACGFQAPADA